MNNWLKSQPKIESPLTRVQAPLLHEAFAIAARDGITVMRQWLDALTETQKTTLAVEILTAILVVDPQRAGEVWLELVQKIK
jgi:hypothetical protein